MVESVRTNEWKIQENDLYNQMGAQEWSIWLKAEQNSRWIVEFFQIVKNLSALRKIALLHFLIKLTYCLKGRIGLSTGFWPPSRLMGRNEIFNSLFTRLFKPEKDVEEWKREENGKTTQVNKEEKSEPNKNWWTLKRTPAVSLSLSLSRVLPLLKLSHILPFSSLPPQQHRTILRQC